ncbi:LLM class F420-dependent oxidoreductase [Lacisediminihabitans changchengi]|uniref:LLM class F420-dependent oxidoreductase n=1 Tax=Lacisediminihabitans changchengi TaxID=2787634 RepID=A0A934SJL3_9MICO|nr:LLM class F420-dependent oxidoreductase [Lacisediminihabitans changchengi]MBK4346077.1 LLM class F420-dependent oxidoreductase [Lacisediminihabitans changchengi]
MDFRIFVEPQQGASYLDQLAVAQAAEKLGFSGFFRSDHYLTMGSGDGLPGPTDAWTTLAGLARETSTIRLGTLVSSVTYRLPGILAIQVAQVDQMSDGRAELGLGTGWFEQEHRAYGIPFPAKRFDLLEEQLAIVTGLWSTPVGETFSFSGDTYRLDDSPALPKPHQARVPVIVGGAGPRRTPALAARYATEFNIGFQPFGLVEGFFSTVREAAEEIGRDPRELTYSVAYPTFAGATEAEAARRAAATGRAEVDAGANLYGTPDQIVDRLGWLAESGTDRVYLQILDMHDLDHLDFLAREVLPQLT